MPQLELLEEPAIIEGVMVIIIIAVTIVFAAIWADSLGIEAGKFKLYNVKNLIIYRCRDLDLNPVVYSSMGKSSNLIVMHWCMSHMRNDKLYNK